MNFPPGARVLVDGRYEAIVVQAFPEGSTSYLFPHYELRSAPSRFAEVFVVSADRVGVFRHPVSRAAKQRHCDLMRQGFMKVSR
jgi:hypothetical protein